MDTAELRALFVRHWSGELAPELLPRAEAALAAMWSRAVAGWPDVEIAPDVFVAFVAERLPSDEDALKMLSAVRAADMYLACGCARADANALAGFEAHGVPAIRRTLRRMGAPLSAVDEVTQMLRERLLVGDRGRPPHIGQYSGRGDLRRWLRAVATRTYLNTIRKVKREVVSDDDRLFDAVSATAPDPEIVYMTQLYGREVKRAFSHAVEGLSDRAKNVLRYSYIDGLSLVELATVYQISRATAHRWLVKARTALAAATENELRRRLKVSKGELASIRRLVASQIEVSVRRLFTDNAEQSPDTE